MRTERKNKELDAICFGVFITGALFLLLNIICCDGSWRCWLNIGIAGFAILGAGIFAWGLDVTE